MAKFDLKGMLSERSTQEIDLPEQKTVYRNPEDLIPYLVCGGCVHSDDTFRNRHRLPLVLNVLMFRYLCRLVWIG